MGSREMSKDSLNITKDFVVISPDKKATPEHFGPAFYEDLAKSYDGFKGHELISVHEFNEDWSTWEIHPKGDEVVILLSGEVTFVLQHEDGESLVTLTEEDSYVIVPKGVWHTVRTNTKSKMLFITPGEGTLNKDADVQSTQFDNHRGQIEKQWFRHYLLVLLERVKTLLLFLVLFYMPC
ncbi:hypothetical protein GQR58_003439 [Nymphon striatum]|nr:hypothetical protein GQR58_003439 [Nymphon striatum]